LNNLCAKLGEYLYYSYNGRWVIYIKVRGYFRFFIIAKVGNLDIFFIMAKVGNLDTCLGGYFSVFS